MKNKFRKSKKDKTRIEKHKTRKTRTFQTQVPTVH